MELINIKSFKKKAKKRYVLHLVFVSLFLALAVTGLILSLLLSNLEYTPNMIINIVLSVLVAVFAIFYFFNIFPLIRHYYRFFKNMNEVALERHRRRVFEEELPSKNINLVKYRVVLFSYSEGEKEYRENLYVLDNDVEFKKGQPYKIATYHNVIIKCEEILDAKD